MKASGFQLFVLTSAIIFSTAAVKADNTFENIVTSIVAESPHIKQLESLRSSELESIRADKTLDGLSIEAEHLWSGVPGENRWSVEISQSFRWPGFYVSANKEANAYRSVTEFQLAAAKTDLTQKASIAIINYLHECKRAEMLALADSSMKTIAATQERLYQLGHVSILDVNHSAVEAAKIGADYSDALVAVEQSRADLEALGYNHTTMPNLDTDLDLPYFELHSDSIYIEAINHSPALMAALAEKNLSDRRVEVARASGLPGFDLGYKHAHEDGIHFNGLTVGLSLPLWRRSKVISSAHSTALAASFQVETIRTEALANVYVLLKKAHLLQTRIGLLAPPIENTNNQILLRRAYDGGQISLSEYLTESNYFLEARLMLLKLKGEFACTMVQLNNLLKNAF